MIKLIKNHKYYILAMLCILVCSVISIFSAVKHNILIAIIPIPVMTIGSAKLIALDDERNADNGTT